MRRSAIAVILMAVLAGCGSTVRAVHVGGRAGQVSATKRHGAPGAASAASCAALSPSAQFAGARIILLGTMSAGATAPFESHAVLASPARVRVIRYLKGGGPRVVDVATAVTLVKRGTQVVEDGIAPRAGERWKIYTTSTRPPYQTSICAGSKPIHQ